MISGFIAEPNCGREIVGDKNPSVISSQKLTCLLLAGLNNLQNLKFVVLPLPMLSDSFTNCKLRNGKFLVSTSCWLPKSAYKCLFYLTECWQEPATGSMSILPPFPEIQCKTGMWNHNLAKHLVEGLIVVKKLKCSTAQSLHIKGVLQEEHITILCHGNKLHELTPATPNNELLCLCL